MGTHPIFESDFDCLTEFRMENQMQFRSAGLTNAIGGFPMGLVLIEKELKGDGMDSSVNMNPIMSEDILIYAKREAARIKRQNDAIRDHHDHSRDHPPDRFRDVPFPAARYRNDHIPGATQSAPKQPNTIRATKSVTISHKSKSATSNISNRKSSQSLRSDLTSSSRLSSQLCHIRSEIEGMADRLAEEVPSDLEDVDTEFDDESNRWFAREFYA